MLDFGSEDFDSMDDEVGDEQEPAPVGRWKATSSYDIYMVDTPQDGDGDGTAGDDTSKKQPKRRRQRRRSKSRQSKNGDSGTGDNTTPDSAEEHPLQQDSTQEDGEASPHERAATERSRMIITCLPQKTRQASTTTSSSCQRISPNKSVLNAGLWPRQAASRKSSNRLELIRIC